MTNELVELRMSQLADGELASDDANELLLSALDDAAARERLKEILRLRQSTVAWRTREPDGPVMVVAERPRAFRASRHAWRMGSLAIAACVGAVLVLAGVWTASWLGRPGVPEGRTSVPGLVAAVSVTPEQMQQVANVFAFHESVAGPLAWYAADDQNIRVASAKGTEAAHKPIGVVLKLASATGVPRTYVIVCRDQEPSVIDLPSPSGGGAGPRLYLSPRSVNGTVEMQYAIAVEGGSSPQGASASLSGQRRLGPVEASLGQLATGDRVVNIEAAAWPIRQELAK
jgi:hypothetical protein